MSAIAIQLIQWRPLPRRPPTPSRNGVSILASAPPRRSSTMPVRLHDANAGVAGRRRRRLPVLADGSEKIVAGAARLVEHFVAALP